MASRANDGQSLWDQDSATQNLFIHTYGSETAANEHWVDEHNDSLGSSNRQGSSDDDEAQWRKDVLDAYKKSSGFDRIKENDLVDYQNRTLQQTQRQFDATLAYKLKTLKADRDRIAIERGTAAANQWYQEQQVRLADQTHQLAVSQLGLDYLKTDVDYRSSPDNYFKLADFEAGARSRQDVPVFLQNLQNNVQGAAYQAPGGMPTPQGIGTGIQALGGSLAPGVGGSLQAASMPGQDLQGASASTVGSQGTQGWSGQDVSALNAIGQLYAQGAHKLSPGALESMSSDNRALLGAGIARLGGSPKAFMELYQKSRPGQGSALAA